MGNRRIPAFFSVREIASALGVSEKTVRRLIAAGDLREHRVGRQLRVSEEDYQAFLAVRRGYVVSK